MKTAEVEIGRLIARTVNRDISLLECSSLVQEQLDLIKLAAERSGYERGVRESAKQCLVKEEIGIGFSPRNRIPSEIHNAILSLLDKKETK